MTTMYHIDARGNARRCVAQLRDCPFGIHGETEMEARTAFEATMAADVFTLPKPTAASQVERFTQDSFYGSTSPREVQLAALNAVAEALENDDATQLVAACGTGKSYMGRQLLQHEMLKEDANGISVILTSSIKLAADTAADLRPSGGYDGTMGVYGRDYEVIEVHSGVRRNDDVEQTVLENGVISTARIQAQLAAAVEAGKRVIIVSTYDSCGRVQEAQAALGDPRYEADIIMHDEAHNVLGQQRPTTVASDDNALTAYTGFSNTIPGAIQAKKRLYATASPVLREAPGDADEPETLEDAVAVAEKMKAGDQWARLTYYSDNVAVVGRVSGFISQEDAIQAGCLARPEYSVRESRVKGSLKTFTEPVVAPDGSIMEKADSTARNPLSVQTYGAVSATLNALVADPEPGKNPPTNVLAYTGSIAQAEAYSEAFAQVARAEAAGMTAPEASLHVDSSDLALRRRARMALLAEHADVVAAHSSTDPESVRNRKKGFTMFTGHGVQDEAWSPSRRVLANVDIFSEGVSISEIDAVVISDDEKCSERAMTQAIGRSIRVIPGNGFKTTGHVIVPSVTDSDNVHVTEASVHLAAYGATRVERALMANKLRGDGVRPDEKTTFTVHSPDGRVDVTKGRTLAQGAVAELMPLAAASEVRAAHTYLLKNEPGYREANAATQTSYIKGRIAEKASAPRTGEADRARLTLIGEHIATKTPHELREERRNARVVTSALSVGDVSSLNPELVSRLISGGVLTTNDSVATVDLTAKREHLATHAAAISFALTTTPAGMSDSHRRLNAALPEHVRNNKAARGEAMKLLSGRGSATPATEALNSSFRELLKDDSFAEAAYAFSQENDRKALPLVDSPFWKPVVATLTEQETSRQARQHDEALSGEQTYSVNPEAVRKSGELTSRTLRALLRG